MLEPKIERLPDDRLPKPRCLFALSSSFDSVGNRAEYKRLLTRALKIWRERGDDPQVVQTLTFLAESNELLDFWREGIKQAREALGIYERLDDTSGQTHSLQLFAWSLHGDNQLDAAEEAASRAVELLSDQGKQFRVCQCHRVLGKIYSSKNDTAKAITRFQTVLEIASSFHWHDEQVCNRCFLAQLFFGESRFDDAHAHGECARVHAINDPYLLGQAIELQAGFRYRQCQAGGSI